MQLIFCFLLLLLNFRAAAKTILVVVHDAGESNFMKPVLINVLKRTQKSIRVLALGSPAQELFSDSEFSDVLVTPQSLGLDTVVVDGNIGREQTLEELDMEKILQALPPTHMEIVITGMVYMMESQIAGAYRGEGNRVVGIFDSFALWDESSICARDFIDVDPPTVNEIWLCAQEQNTQEFGRKEIEAVVTGSPTLSEWRRKASSDQDRRKTREILLKAAGRDPIHDESIFAVYAGGYGGSTYNESVKIFCQVCASASESAAKQSNDLLCLFSPHPGYSPSIERDIFESYHCASSVLVIEDNFNLSTSAVVSVSNASLSQCSTVGGQSLAVSVPHAYVNGPHDSCVDVFTSAHLIDSVTDPAALSKKLLVDFKREQYYIRPELVQRAGVPLDGEANVLVQL